MEKRKINHIYWFAYYNLDSPSVRYRAKYPLEFAKESLGISSNLIVPGYSPKMVMNFIVNYLSAMFFPKKNSVIVIQRVRSNFIYSNLLKLLVRVRKKQTIYDIDDADYLEGNPKTIYFFAKHCETISVGSTQIQKHLSQFNNQIIHTTSPIVDLKIVKKSRNDIFCIGWIGGFGGEHKDSLIELVFPAIKELNFPLKFIILGILKLEDIEFVKKYFQDNSNIEIELPLGIDWNDEVDLQKRIACFDIGIATLTNSELQLSKSGIKAKQYMNNGVPVLSSNLPENNTVIFEGVNGCFCDTAADFKDKLIQFHEMTDTEFMQFSVNARKSISNFNHNRYFEELQKITNGGKAQLA